MALSILLYFELYTIQYCSSLTKAMRCPTMLRSLSLPSSSISHDIVTYSYLTGLTMSYSIGQTMRYQCYHAKGMAATLWFVETAAY